jgi:hypothetical protein
MWIFTSLGRPDLIRRIVDSYAWGGETRVILALYDGDKRLPEYLAQKWPAGWQTKIVTVLGNGPTYNEIFSRYPSESCYGFLADDAILDIPGMLRQLEEGAGDWNIAYANDKHWGEKLPTMPCIGGHLARAIGFLSPPQIIHWAIDTAWGEIGRRLGNLRYFPHLTYTHLNPVWGTAPDDATYQRSRMHSFGWEEILRSWIINDLPSIIERVNVVRKEVECSV